GARLLHVGAAGAAPLIAAATRELNAARVPFALKVLDHPARFTRRDAAVLYLQAFEPAHAALREIVSACSGFLRPGAPAFALELTHGVGVGEHLPRHGGSFGTSRCR